MVYSTISAVDGYLDVGKFTTVGGIYYNVTRAYPSDALQTMPAACYHAFGTYRTLKVENLIDPPQNWISNQQCVMAMGGNPDGSQYSHPNGTEQAAFPDLSLPADMSTYDPAWSGCSQISVNGGIWDPPRVLTPVPVMMPSTTSRWLSLPSSTADPGWRPADSLPDTRSAAIPTAPGASIDPDGPPKITQSASVSPGANHGIDGEHDNPSQAPSNVHADVTTVKHEDQSNVAVPPSSVVVVEHHTVYALSDERLSMNGMTITAGASAITVDELPVSVDEAAVYVAGSSYVSYRPAAAPSPNPPQVGGQEVKAEPGGRIAIGDSTITQGGQVTIAETPVSVDFRHVVIGTSTYAKPTMPGFVGSGSQVTDSLQNGQNQGGNSALADTIATPMMALPFIESQKLSTLVNGAIVVGDSTFSQGAQATFTGTPISVGSSFVVIGGSTFGLAVSRPTGSASLIGGQTIQRATGAGIIIGSLTLSQGSQTMISGTPVSVEPKSIVIGGTSYQLPSATGNSLEIDGQSFEHLASGKVVVFGHTMSVDAQTTVSALHISVGATDVVIAGSTYELDSISSSKSTDAIGAMVASMFGFVSSSTQSRSRTVDSGITGTLAPTGFESSQSTSELVNLSASASSSGFESFIGASESLTVNSWVLLITVLCGIAVGALV